MERKLTVTLDIDDTYWGDIDYYFDDLDDDIKAAIVDAFDAAGKYFINYKLTNNKEEN